MALDEIALVSAVAAEPAFAGSDVTLLGEQSVWLAALSVVHHTCCDLAICP
jgi:hypothetical protein